MLSDVYEYFIINFNFMQFKLSWNKLIVCFVGVIDIYFAKKINYVILMMYIKLLVHIG